MCYVQIAMAAVAVVTSYMQNKAANKAAKEQEDAINAQNAARAEEIADASSAEMNERARNIRRARASARAAASEAGINLSSGSFLGQMQALNAQQDMEAGLVTKNTNNKHRARHAQYKSGLAGIQYKTGLGIALDATQAGVSAYTASGGEFGAGAKDSWTPIFG